MSFIAYFSGARRRLAFSERVNPYRRNLNRGYDRLFTDLLYDASVQHQVKFGLRVIDFLGGKPQDEKLELWSTHEDEAFVQTLLANAGARKGEMLIAFGAGARRPKRAWPLMRFIQLGQWLIEHYGARIVGIGGAEEEALGREMQNRLGHHFMNAVGKTTLRQSYCLLRHCILFVGNDTGPKHLAAAAGVPVVEISWHAADASAMHLESPDRFHAWGVPLRIVRPPHPRKPCTEGCSSTEAHCILGVELEMVEQAVEDLLPTIDTAHSRYS
jgi:heptosyltransferase-2